MSIHTRIDQPITMRKDLLECAIDCAEILRSVENVKKIHDEREIVKKKLKIVTGKLSILNSRLYRDLPRLQRERAVAEEPEIPKFKPAPQPRPKKPRAISQEDRANKELEDLRRKIESL